MQSDKKDKRMKSIKAVNPYIYPGRMNFKDKPFEVWRKSGGGTVKGSYPRFLHKLMFNFDMPTLWHGEARLCFVQPVSLYFDTFFAGINHEIIPFVWDCWPCYFDKMERWLKRHKVKTAIFTSRQEMDEMRMRIPEINYLWCPEAIDAENYHAGEPLVDRSIDILEFGRSNEKIFGCNTLQKEGGRKLKHVATKVGNKFLYTNEQLHEAMQDAKVTICLPRSMTDPDTAENVETLTQRYWEAMLSRMVIIGHAPQELIDVCGYNPVIELEMLTKHGGLAGIINNISKYQEFVDRNRVIALERGDWTDRMLMVSDWLNNTLEYEISRSSKTDKK